MTRQPKRPRAMARISLADFIKARSIEAARARPEPMRGWVHLWAAADIIRPALVVIDPALDAYTGDAARGVLTLTGRETTGHWQSPRPTGAAPSS